MILAIDNDVVRAITIAAICEMIFWLALCFSAGLSSVIMMEKADKVIDKNLLYRPYWLKDRLYPRLTKTFIIICGFVSLPFGIWAMYEWLKLRNPKFPSWDMSAGS